VSDTRLRSDCEIVVCVFVIVVVIGNGTNVLVMEQVCLGDGTGFGRCL
jgi:hypothetical protein